MTNDALTRYRTVRVLPMDVDKHSDKRISLIPVYLATEADLLISNLRAELEAERAKVGRMNKELQSAADLLLALNKVIRKNPMDVTAIDMWLAERALPAAQDEGGRA